MVEVFKIRLEFEKALVAEKIQVEIEKGNKCYICAVDGNVLANARKIEKYRSIINNSMLNICDGSSIALLTNMIYGTHYSAYTGPMIFREFLYKGYKQLLLGNTEDILNQIKSKLILDGCEIKNYGFQSLPFKPVDEFDYRSIADDINKNDYDIVWVSLGAPKQEIFVSKLTPLLNKGVVFAIGAAFNLMLDEKKETRFVFLMKKLHLGWLLRVIKEPKRVGGRAWNYFKLLPELIVDEYKVKIKEKTK